MDIRQVGDLNAPGVPDGPEDRLPVVPPHSADLEVVGWAEGTSRGRMGRLGRGRRIRWSRRRTPGGVSMTIIEGVSSALLSTWRAAAWSTVRACAQVPLRDQWRNCDQARVQGPNDAGR